MPSFTSVSAAPAAPVSANPVAAASDPTVRPALALLAAWLLITAVPLTGMMADPGASVARARHLVLFAAALLALGLSYRVPPRPAGTARDDAGAGTAGVAAELWTLVLAWLPLVAVPALYAELPLIAAGLAGSGTALATMHDAVAIRWELAVFGPVLGASPAIVLARAVPWTPLSEVLHLAYLSYYVIIYVPPALFWWEARRRRAGASLTGAADPQAAFTTSAFTVLLAFLLCYSVFVVFPVQGPWYTWQTGGRGGLPLSGLAREFVQGLLLAGSSRGTAFPSSHVAVSVAQTLVLARVAPRLAWIAAPTTALLALGAVYGGYHYGVDAIVGAVFGATAGSVGPWLLALRGRRAMRGNGYGG
ncbi:MAG TPA: phosphatase PAP2 family protein [Gemmatirosa sp.]